MKTQPIVFFVAFSSSLLSALLLCAPAPVANAATCTVTNAVDDGSTAGTLRVLLADPTCDTITFGGNHTIPASDTLGVLVISRTLTIDGTGYSVTLSGDSDGDGTPNAEVLLVASGVTATLRNLTGHANGSDSDGAGMTVRRPHRAFRIRDRVAV